MPHPPIGIPLPRLLRTLPKDKAGMVGWYNPIQLLQTAARLLLTSISAWQAPARSQPTQPQSPEFIDYSSTSAAPDAPFWFDFVADCGDGWNPTFAVASSIARL